MAQLFANNGHSTLNGAILIGDTAITLNDTSDMPTPSGVDYFLLTITDIAAGTMEVVKVTDNTANVLTVIRGHEGAAQAWPDGTVCQMNETRKLHTRREMANDILVHDMASDADYTLSTSGDEEWWNGEINITDITPNLTAARNIIVPNDSKIYIFRNDTLQTLTLKTAAGSGIAIAPSSSELLRCDGTNVIRVQIPEEGAFTPFLYGATTAGTPTYTVQLGDYQIIGGWCKYSAQLTLSSKGGMVGAIRMGGLPRAAANDYHKAGTVGVVGGANVTAGYAFACQTRKNETNVAINLYDATTGTSSVADTEITDTFNIILSGEFKML